MLSDEMMDRVIERLTQRIDNTNEFILKQIGGSIKKIGALTPTEAHRVTQILKYGGDYNKIVNELAKMTSLSKKDIYEIFEEVAKQDYAFAKQFYEAKGKPYIPYDENIALQTQVRALARQTANEFTNLTRTMAFANVVDGEVVYSPIAEAYHDILDKALLSVSQGKTTFDEQLRQSMMELASNGITAVEYESGRTLRLDSALRMQMRGGLRELHNQTQMLLGEEFDSDGVEISVHFNPAPDHEFVQGKQFSNEEFEKFQNDEDATSYDGTFFSADYNGHDRRSIGEYNCYHYVFAVVLGVNKPEYTNKQLKQIINTNNKGFKFEGKHYTNYEGTQLQRKMELAIRKQKDVQILGRSSGDKELVRKSQDKIRLLSEKYNDLSKASGLPTKAQRLKVSGYKRVSTK